MPCELEIRDLVSTTLNIDGESYNAPSVASIINTASEEVGEGMFNMDFSNVNQNGFLYQPKTMLTRDDLTNTTQDSWPYCE